MNHLIIIPTYNEAQTIKKIIDTIFSSYNSLSILVVDDSSPDGTSKIVQDLMSKYPKLHLLIQEAKGGLALAYINGMKWGINKGFDVFTSCDADFSHNPKYFNDIIQYINEGYELVVVQAKARIPVLSVTETSTNGA